MGACKSKIDSKKSTYDEDNKYYYNTVNIKYYEYVFTKNIKNDVIDLLISQLKQYKKTISIVKKYLIFHNFQFVNCKYFRQFQSIIESLSSSVIFIFTSSKKNEFELQVCKFR